VEMIYARWAMTRATERVRQGSSVRVVSGPFRDFTGTITEVNPDKGKLWVSISMFGRDTPVELDFHQVAKL
jgi:Transcription antiterminator